MTVPLLTTKLYVPPPRPDLVERPRLLECLNEGLHLGHRLTLVVAPAGFGKTTLLSRWVAGLDRPVAWLSCDESDSDPRRAIAYLVAALRTLPAAQNLPTPIGESFLTAIPAQLDARGSMLLIEAALGSLINELVALPPFILVFDDYHLIDNPYTHDGVVFLLDHLPASVHLVIASRAEPPLPIARLRARGQLTELNTDELRFTPEEAATFLGNVGGSGTHRRRHRAPGIPHGRLDRRPANGVPGLARATGSAELVIGAGGRICLCRHLCRGRPLHHGLSGRRGAPAAAGSCARVSTADIDPGTLDGLTV